MQVKVWIVGMSMLEAAAMESFLQGATKTTKRGGRRTNIAWMTLDRREGGREEWE